MMPLQEMSDRLEIQDLFARYTYAIDDRDYDALDTVFTPDAVIDYSETGGAKGSVAEIKRWLPVAMEKFPK
ncbi:MAG: nuclear transport factor 2 family protein, partial [Sphingomonas sp.]